MLRERLTDELKVAMKAKDQRRVGTLRLILAALKDREIAARSHGDEGLRDEDVLEMLAKMVRQRRESIDMYDKAGRDDLAAQEQAEIAVIEEFLPRQLSDAEIEHAVADVLAEVEAKSLKDMGKIMAALKARHAGVMDMAKASRLVKSALA